MDANKVRENTVKMMEIKKIENEKRNAKMVEDGISTVENLIISAQNQARFCMTWKMPSELYNAGGGVYGLILEEFEKRGFTLYITTDQFLFSWNEIRTISDILYKCSSNVCICHHVMNV